MPLEPELKVYGPRLGYDAEMWLFRKSSEAWGDHKSILYCPDEARRRAKWEGFTPESRHLINEAMKRRRR